MTDSDWQARHYFDLWNSLLDEPSFVYVMEAQQGGPIKVGRAKDPWTRAKELQTGNPYPLRVLHVLPGDHNLEWQLHHKLKASRLQGEWFHGPAIPVFLAFLEELIRKMVELETTDFRCFGEWSLHKSPGVTTRFADDAQRAQFEADRQEAHRRGEEAAELRERLKPKLPPPPEVKIRRRKAA